MNINIAQPIIGEAEQQAVMDVLKSGYIVQGPVTAEFEQRFAEFHGAKHGIGMNNGTSALIASMMAHDIDTGDEVIIPGFSFFATASCVLSTGATPVFADIDPETYNMSPESAEALITDNTKAIMPVHLYGQIADMSAYQALCEKHGLVLLEDAAQAHAATSDGKFAGSWGTASFSFYATKNITTGEGGMVLTNDDAIAEKLRMIRNQGMSTQYYHEVVGYNLRLTNMASAIGLKQLDSLQKWTDARIENAAYYDETLRDYITPKVVSGNKHVYHQYTLRVPDGANRDAIMTNIQEQGIGARVYYPAPIYAQPIFQKMGYGDVSLPETERACAEIFSIPVHPALTQEERAYIVEKLNTALESA